MSVTSILDLVREQARQGPEQTLQFVGLLQFYRACQEAVQGPYSYVGQLLRWRDAGYPHGRGMEFGGEGDG